MSGASVGSVVNAQAVTESVVSNPVVLDDHHRPRLAGVATRQMLHETRRHTEGWAQFDT